MKKIIIKIVCVAMLFGIVSSVGARDFFGRNNSFFGNSGYGDYNDWPEWTPMYWMEEFFGDNDGFGNNRFKRNRYRPYGGYYGNPYQSPYASPYSGLNRYNVNPYLANPYGANRYPGHQAYRYVPYASVYPQANLYGPRANSFSSPFGNRGISPFSTFGTNPYSNPLTPFTRSRSPFSTFGGSSPWSGFSSPLGGGMPGMSPLGGLGGFGSPMSPMGGFGSPMSPMGTMGMPGMSPFGGGMPGMSPMGGFGGAPFGTSQFNPFR